MKNHRFPWLRNRTTDNRKCEKARNIKEKRTIEMFSQVSKPQEKRPSSPRDKFYGVFIRNILSGKLLSYICVCVRNYGRSLNYGT